MKCPHCGAALVTAQRTWQARMLAQGRCVICGRVKFPVDGPYQRCRACRLREAARSQRRYRRLRGAGLKGAM